MKNIILFDVDGTLYDNKNKIVPVSTKKAIKELHKDERNILVIATGRSPYQIDVLDDIIEFFDYRVLINGQVTMKDSELVGSNPMSLELKSGIFNYLEKHKISGGFVGLNEQCLNLSSKIVESALDYIETKVPRVSKTFHLENDIYQIWLFAPNTIAKEIEREFEEVRCVSWYEKGFDILPKGVSKVNGIKRILENFDDEITVYAFGDGNNDIEMIKFANYGVAMGNGTDALKEVADHVTDEVSQDGIIKGLIHFGLLK